MSGHAGVEHFISQIHTVLMSACLVGSMKQGQPVAYLNFFRSVFTYFKLAGNSSRDHVAYVADTSCQVDLNMILNGLPSRGNTVPWHRAHLKPGPSLEAFRTVNFFFFMLCCRIEFSSCMVISTYFPPVVSLLLTGTLS